MATGVSIKNFTHFLAGRQRAAFAAAAKRVLPHWDISLSFIGPLEARALNKRLRGKDYIPNVLSYAVGKRSAEIIICPSKAVRQAPDFSLSAKSFLLLLFIHGLLHLKGWTHNGTMERCERKLLARYGTAYSYRHRHRHVPSKAGRR